VIAVSGGTSPLVPDLVFWRILLAVPSRDGDHEEVGPGGLTSCPVARCKARLILKGVAAMDKSGRLIVSSAAAVGTVLLLAPGRTGFSAGSQDQEMAKGGATVEERLDRIERLLQVLIDQGQASGQEVTVRGTRRGS
jgi:hypothetical protein